MTGATMVASALRTRAAGRLAASGIRPLAFGARSAARRVRRVIGTTRTAISAAVASTATTAVVRPALTTATRAAMFGTAPRILVRLMLGG